MAFKFVVLCSVLALANAGVIAPVTTYEHKLTYANPAVDAVASTHENVVRSFGGTVSTHSKAVDTPYSSVRKEETRVSNNVYAPALAKTVSYAAPAVSAYTAPAYTAPAYTAPAVVKTVGYAAAPSVAYVAPAVAKTVSYTAPTPTAAALYAHAAPVVASAAPIVYSSAPTVPVVKHIAPAPAVYAHAAAPVKTVSYAAPVKTVSYAAPVATTSYSHGPAATTYTHNAPGVSGYGTSQTVHYSPAEMVSHMSFDGFGTHWGF